MRSKIVQVPVDAEFLERVDTGAGLVKESRAEFFRQAAALRLRQLDDLEGERRYEDGYARCPDGDPGWAEASASFLAAQLPEEQW